MKDRVVQYPGRYRDRISGQLLDLVPEPGTVTEPGTPYAVHTVLADRTAALYGLGGEATLNDVLITIGGPFVPGMILMWSGSADTIPTGWQLCDGSNGTPDLRDRFVAGAGGKYALGATGGSETVSIAHSHSFSATTSNESTRVTIQSGSSSYRTAAAAHTHTVSGTTGSSGGDINNLPPYFALCYIQKMDGGGGKLHLEVVFSGRWWSCEG